MPRGRSGWSVDGPADRELDQLMTGLLDSLSLSRATLRLDVPDDPSMPMTHEVLAPGVPSVGGRVVTATGSPTVEMVMRTHEVLAVDDTSRAIEIDPVFDDDRFRAMVRDYGGLASYIAAPVFEDDRLVGIVSLHHLGAPREWSAAEIHTSAAAAARAGELRAVYIEERIS